MRRSRARWWRGWGRRWTLGVPLAWPIKIGCGGVVGREIVGSFGRGALRESRRRGSAKGGKRNHGLERPCNGEQLSEDRVERRVGWEAGRSCGKRRGHA